MNVVVGVSPDSGSPAALQWAAAEAKLRAIPLLAVMAWRPPRAPAAPGGRPPASAASLASDDYAGDALMALRGFVTQALGTDDGIRCEVVRGSAAKALLSMSQGAQLLVLGERDSSRLTSVRSGLLAPQLVYKASCPVVVLPARLS